MKLNLGKVKGTLSGLLGSLGVSNVANDVTNALNDLLDPTIPITPDTLTQPSTLSFIGSDVARAIASAIPTPTVTAPATAPFSTIYAFGDSLSDAGNISLATLGLLPVSPPYQDRVFSNGPTWVQDLAQDLGLPAVKPSLAGGTDFAFGGAETGQTPQHTLSPIDLPSQLGQFAAQVPSPQPNALYAMWIGSNDVLDILRDNALTPAQQQSDVTAAVNNEVAGITALAARGAQDFLVLNVPNLGITPYEQARPAQTATATALSSQYDTELATALHTLEASGALKIDLVDTYSILDQVDANPTAYGFTNVTNPVWTGNLTSPDSGTLNAVGAAQNQYLFFDGLHPTAQAHALLASGIASAIA